MSALVLPRAEVGLDALFPVILNRRAGTHAAHGLADHLIIELCAGVVGVVIDGAVSRDAEFMKLLTM